LVSCPIALYTATSPERARRLPADQQENRNRLRQQLIDEENKVALEAFAVIRDAMPGKDMVVWAAWSFPSASAWSCSSREAAVCSARP